MKFGADGMDPMRLQSPQKVLPSSKPSDWLAFPGQLDMLDDYVGWVQTSPTMPEVVYHAGGQPVLFNLQVASLSCHATTGGVA